MTEKTTGVSDRLRRIRAEFGVGQSEMAAILGITLRPYQDYEAGKRLPSGDALQALARKRVDVNWLLTGIAALNQEPQKASRSTVDTPLLRDCIEVLHEELQRRRATLTPAQEAEAISLLYDLARPEPGQEAKPVDRGVVVRLLRMVG